MRQCNYVVQEFRPNNSEKKGNHDNRALLVSLFNPGPLSFQYYNHCCKVKYNYINIKCWPNDQNF